MPLTPALDHYDAFYARTFDRIARSVRALAGADADDVAQEAFLVARARWADVGRLERPEAWVRKVARRMAARRARRELERDRLEAASAPPQGASKPPDLDLVAAVLGLPDRHATAIRLHHLEDRPVAELAELLGCSEGAAKVLLLRARRVLAERLIGLTGRWVSERAWSPDDIARHLVSVGSGAHVGPVLEEDLGGRGGRWELTIDDGAYLLQRDDGFRLDHGSSRVDGRSFEMAPTLNGGRERYQARVDGRYLSFELVDSTCPSTRGVPDEVWVGLFLEASPFVRADGDPARL